jgi:hypothetical protein
VATAAAAISVIEFLWPAEKKMNIFFFFIIIIIIKNIIYNNPFFGECFLKGR